MTVQSSQHAPARGAVWFYYSKSLNCCIEIRKMLDDGSGLVCPPAAFTAPCREFVGNCADTEEQARAPLLLFSARRRSWFTARLTDAARLVLLTII